jgi:hypothetical protein
VSSRIDHEAGTVTISAPCYATMGVGHVLYVSGSTAAFQAGARADYKDYVARLTLSRSSNGHAWGEGVRVLPPEGALAQAIENGSVHPSLVSEPRVAA